MNENIKINFANVKFHIKEFQKVYILENCSLVFYKPSHLKTRDKESGEEFKDKDKKEIHKEQEIIKINSQEAKQEEKEDVSKETAKVYAENIDREINALTENTYKENIKTQTKQERQKKFENYDIFYDIYTSNKDESVNKKIGFNPDGFKVKDGIATVEAEFFQECFKQGIYHLIPRLVSKQKDEDLHFDPVPLEDKGFVITDFRAGKKDIDLTFQRKIAKVENPDLTLQTPKEFHRMLNGGDKYWKDRKERNMTQKDIEKDIKKQQAEATQKACELRASEMEKIILEQDESLKDIINDKTELDKKIHNLQDKPNRTAKETSLLGRLQFLQMNQNKAERYEGIAKALEPQEETDPHNQEASKDNNQQYKPIHSKDIGDTGECVASLLFEKKSTRHLSNRRKLDANFNTNGFNHTIPDFLVTLNDYPSLVEVKNVQTQSLTEQISFELKLAREYELDYLFVCNHYTQLMDNITNLVEFDAEKAEHTGSRKGFIYHRHLHRSIKTIFKEIYLHHIKGAAPNKIMVKRLDLNDSNKLEKELNKNKGLQDS